MNKETPISAKDFEELFRPRSFMPAEEPYLGPRMYSLGWRTGVYHGHKFYEHTGGSMDRHFFQIFAYYAGGMLFAT